MPIKLNQSVSSNQPINQYLIDLYKNPATIDEYDTLYDELVGYERNCTYGLIQDVLILVVVENLEKPDLVTLRLTHKRLSVDMIDDLLAIVPTALLIVNPNLSAQQIFILHSFCTTLHHPEDMLNLLKRNDVPLELRTANIIINDETTYHDLINLKQVTPLLNDIIDDSVLLNKLTVPIVTWSKLINLPVDTRMIMSTPAQHQIYLQDRERERQKLLSLLARAC